MLECVLCPVCCYTCYVSPTSDLFFCFLCCRQHSVPRDDGGGVLLGRTGRQSGQEAVSPDLHVCQRILCLPLFICPRLWLLSPLSFAFWIRVRFFSFLFYSDVFAPNGRVTLCKILAPRKKLVTHFCYFCVCLRSHSVDSWKCNYRHLNPRRYWDTHASGPGGGVLSAERLVLLKLEFCLPSKTCSESHISFEDLSKKKLCLWQRLTLFRDCS